MEEQSPMEKHESRPEVLPAVNPALPPTAGGRPWLTWLACGICIFVFIGLHLEDNYENPSTLAKWGSYSSWHVWRGAYWGSVTSVFVHGDMLHLAFNVYWLWILGGAVERVMGRRFWLLLFLASAVVSSGLQLAVSGHTGFGASGVGYAFFGFLWVAARKEKVFDRTVSPQIVRLFMTWLFLCVLLTYTNIMPVGNAAHFSGLIFGIGVAAAFVLNWQVPFTRFAVAGLFAASIVPLFWCPWSISWLLYKATEAVGHHQYDKAVYWHSRVIERDPMNALAYFERGLDYTLAKDTAKAEADFKRAKELDPDMGKSDGNEQDNSSFDGKVKP